MDVGGRVPVAVIAERAEDVGARREEWEGDGGGGERGDAVGVPAWGGPGCETHYAVGFEDTVDFCDC